MPCDSGPSLWEVEQARERYELMTRVSCEIAKLIEGTSLWRKLSPEAIEWVEEHREIDRKREAKEAAEKAARDVAFG